MQGEFLPVAAGEVLPGYLQWDSQVEAHPEGLHAAAGIPPRHRGSAGVVENSNRAANGEEAFTFTGKDVEIDWQFERAFGLLEEEQWDAARDRAPKACPA